MPDTERKLVWDGGFVTGLIIGTIFGMIAMAVVL